MIIVLLGPSGSGKDTQAEFIVEKYGIPNIGMGEIFREAHEKGTEDGIEAKKYTDKGNLVPEDITWRLFKERIERKDCEKGFIVNGYCRKLEQAKRLDEYLANKGKKVDLVLHFDLSEEEAVRRLSGRRVCPKCKENYHVDIEFEKPKKEGICDKCGTKLIQRDDDKPDAIRRRMKYYRDGIESLLEYYGKRGVLEEIDASPSVEEVRREIEKVLGVRD